MKERRIHNPEGLTAHQIGEADGWRCLYEGEPVPADAQWFDQMEWRPVRACGAPAGPRDHLTYRTKRSKPADQEEEMAPGLTWPELNQLCQQWQQRAERAEAELQEAATLSHTYRNRAEKAEKDLEWWRTTASNHLDGIDGKLVEAGTIDWKTDLHGLIVEVSVESLREAKRVPLYHKVRVVEVKP